MLALCAASTNDPKGILTRPARVGSSIADVRERPVVAEARHSCQTPASPGFALLLSVARNVATCEFPGGSKLLSGEIHHQFRERVVSVLQNLRVKLLIRTSGARSTLPEAVVIGRSSGTTTGVTRIAPMVSESEAAWSVIMAGTPYYSLGRASTAH